MSDFLTKYHCILDYQSDRVGWSRLSMHAARCRSDRLTVHMMRPRRAIPDARVVIAGWGWGRAARGGLTHGALITSY